MIRRALAKPVIVGALIVASLAFVVLVVPRESAYARDGGGISASDSLAASLDPSLQSGPIPARRLFELYGLIEAGLPAASDLGEFVADGSPDALDINWAPGGRRETLMPPNPRDQRIYAVTVHLGAYIRGRGPAIAEVVFLSRKAADSLSSPDPSRLDDFIDTVTSLPAYSYQLSSATAAALLSAIAPPHQ